MSTTTDRLFEGSTINQNQVRKAMIYVVMYGFALLFVIPYIWMVSQSIQTRNAIMSPTPYIIPPGEISLHWYKFLLSDSLIIQWTFNTFVIAGATTILVLAMDALIAYAITRLDWPGKRVIFSVIVASFMVPGIVNLVPVYTIITNLGLINSYFGVILPATANPIGVFMLVQFFRDFPGEIEEAALLDGFSRIQIFYKLVLPLMKPALTALGLFVFIWTWNNFLWPLIILQETSAFTLPIGLVLLREAYSIEQPGITMTSAVVASIPLFIVFLLLQEQLVRAVKLQGTVG